MAKNDPNNPDKSRLAQDVEAPAIREQENFHYGRGGAANIAKAPDARSDSKERRPHEGIAEKGKEFLDKLVHGSKK
jgi:hypothetical protein